MLASVKKQEGDIVKTWGTGTNKVTMALHIKKALYQNLGWSIGDLMYLVPDYENGTITIRKLDMEKMSKA